MNGYKRCTEKPQRVHKLKAIYLWLDSIRTSIMGEAGLVGGWVAGWLDGWMDDGGLVSLVCCE